MATGAEAAGHMASTGKKQGWMLVFSSVSLDVGNHRKKISISGRCEVAGWSLIF